MGAEGLGRGPAGHRLHHRRLHLHEAAVAQKLADQADDLHPFAEGVAHLGVDDQIQVALAVAGLHVGEAVELLGQGPQRLGDHLQAGGLHAQLAGLGLEQAALDADDVAHVPFLEQPVGLLAEQVATGVHLDAVLRVLQVEEGGLAEAAHGHHPAGDAEAAARFVVRLGGERSAEGQDLADGLGGLEGVAEQADAGLGQGIGLFTALLKEIARCIHPVSVRSVGNGRGGWPATGGTGPPPGQGCGQR